MGRDRHEPPPGLTKEELWRWKQARKFTWLPGDIVITHRPEDDRKKPEEGTDGGRDRDRTTGREG